MDPTRSLRPPYLITLESQTACERTPCERTH
jgi:hypothetical protein